MRAPPPRIAFTLIELMVTLAVVGILAALLMTTINALRGRARQLQCSSNLRELGRAIIQHEQAHGWFPTGGWGGQWTGVLDRGFGVKQPGGWFFNVLPYLDEEPLRQLAPTSHETPDAAKYEAFVTSVVAVQICPERGGSGLIPVSKRFHPRVGTPVSVAARADYAMNGGSSCNLYDNGPDSLSEGDAANYPWPDTSDCTGISFRQSRIHVHEIYAGTSHVLLCGEKVAKPMPTTEDEGMNQPHVSGCSWDIARLSDGIERDHPSADITGFGSAHNSGAGFCFCDGSVRTVNYDIDVQTFYLMGMRRRD